ncbi:MAG: hypothetical protein QOD75_1663, partial [Blastocatellia bacterium]|nr:hypothetical protein [Blastocatellia bacterium]
SGNPTTRYKYYEFDLAGCPSGAVTVNTCGTGACAAKPAGTLTDTIVTVYRKSDGSGTSPGSPIFTPGSPCLNAVTGNNNSNLCGAGSTLSSVTSTLPAGRFGVVVTTNAADQLGTFNLSVTAPGCTVTMVPACSSVSGTVTPSNQTVCPGSSANISVGVSGGTAPYTVSLNNGGGTMNGAGPFTFTVSPAGTTTYTATGSDANGCPIAMSGTATVTVSDTTAPTVTCPADSSASADASCMAAVPNYAAAASASDNCTASGSITKTQSPAAGTMVGLGPHTVTVTATDASGNSSTCTTTFTVNDTTAPVVTCPANSSASADASCQAAVPNYAAAATASDNCSASGSITKTQSPAAGTLVGLGPHTVTVTATDGAGNSSTCTTTFTVNDTTDPVITCPANIITTTDPDMCSATVNPGTATATDNCGATVTGVRSDSQPLNAPYPKGTTTITWTARDSSGNTDTCDQTVTVNDAQNPVITCPANVVTSTDPNTCSATVNPGTATATDNCPGTTVMGVRSDGQPLNVPYPKGTTTITWTATDGSGNTASCQQSVTVNDTTAPVVSCPANSSADADASCQAAVPNYAAAATATDNCGPVTKTQSPAAGTMVGPGPHTVTVTATDAAGNSSTCTTTFTVNDTADPVITCPANVVATTDPNMCSATVNPGTATATDNCSGTTVAVVRSDSQPLNAPYPKGTTTITWTATDGSGNTDTCTQTVTVNDAQNPVITCPANVVSSTDPDTCSATVNPGTATATDNCPGTTVMGVRSDGQALNAPYPKGTTTITWTATDNSGNTASCQQTVTVNDTQAPAITCPANVSTTAAPGTCSANVNPGTATATDNCPGVTVTGTRSDGKPLSDPYPGGVTVITWTATDSSGNQSTCVQTVTVTDTQAPVITVNNAVVTLWPPNHQYETINLTQFVTGAHDNCDSGVDLSDVVITKVTSDELEDNPTGGDGNTLNDIVIAANCKSVQLRAERDGNLNGRVYNITFAVVDSSGNVGTATVKVTVPKSQNGAGAIDDGPKYTKNGVCP